MHGWEGMHKGLCHRRARQAPSHKHECPYARLDEGCPFMEAMTDTVIVCEHNPTALAYCLEPGFVAGILGKMVIMQLDCYPCLSEGIRYDMLAETAMHKAPCGRTLKTFAPFSGTGALRG